MRRLSSRCLTTGLPHAQACLIASRSFNYSATSRAQQCPASSCASVVALQQSMPCNSQTRHRYTGSGATAPALFRATRIARIPPQLARFLVAGGAALLQVFLIAFQRESSRLKYETGEAAGSMANGMGTRQGRMSGVEAAQVLGLDRNYPSLFSEIQKSESGASSGPSSPPSTSSLLPLQEGKAKEEAKRNFERMFALAIKDGNLFLAGKLSAAYRVCVDPMWDQVEEVEGNRPTDSHQRESGEK